MHDVITILSLGLTPLTIIASCAVVYLWWSGAWTALTKEHREPMHWFILGVLVGFIGAVFDNLYWGVAWSLDYINSPYRDAVFDFGVYSNLPFRQIATAAAALCHVRAAITADSTALKTLFGLSSLIGFGGVAVLVWVA